MITILEEFQFVITIRMLFQQTELMCCVILTVYLLIISLNY